MYKVKVIPIRKRIRFQFIRILILPSEPTCLVLVKICPLLCIVFEKMVQL